MYRLSTSSALRWTAAQESGISREYPFQDIKDESPEQYIARTYLQFLWLPEVGGSILRLYMQPLSIRTVILSLSCQ